jgi:hypothetical protein
VDTVQDRPECGVGDALAEDIERLDQRHASLEQSREFLVEDEKLLPLHLLATPAGRQGQRCPSLEGQHVHAFFLQFPPEARLTVGDVDPFYDLAGSRAESTAKLHSVSSHVNL